MRKGKKGIMPAKIKKPVRVKTKATKRLRKQKIGSGLYLAPSFLGVMMFYIIPFAVIIFLLTFKANASRVSTTSGYFKVSIFAYPVISGEKAFP